MPERAGGTSLIFLVLALFTAHSRAEAPRFEVIHFWHAPSERQAFEVISEEFRRRYEVRWIERALPSFDAVRERALQRIVGGYPPTAVQWHPSSEVWDLYDMQVIHSLTPLAHRLRWSEKLPEVVLDTIMIDGEYVGLPTNIHGENLIWYSARLYKKLGLEYPDSWEQLLDQARIMKDAGFPAVAVGAEDWDKRVMFSAILNSLSTQTYLGLVSTGNPALTEAPQLLRSYEIMGALRDASRTGIAQPNWAAATALVGSGKAGMQFMGDWADRELRSHGWAPGADFQCRLPPGNSAAFIIVVDGFMFPVTASETEPLHNEFAEMILEPQMQIEFALKKGALPVIKGLSDERFDECSRIGIEALKDESRLTPSSSMFTTQNFGNAIQSVAVQFWKSDDMSPRQALQLLREELLIVHDMEQVP